MTSIYRVFAGATAATLVCLAAAQADTAPTVTLKILQPTVMANKAVHAVMTITFGQGLHGYQNPPSDPSLIPVTVKSADKSFRVISVEYPKGKASKVIGEPKPINVYEGTVQIPMILQAPAKLGKATVKLVFGYQQCNEQACFPPGSVVAQGNITVVKYTGVVKTMKPPKGR